MKGKTIEILEKFDPDKNYKIHIRKQIGIVLSKLEKSEQCLLCNSADTIRRHIYPKQTPLPSQLTFMLENLEPKLNN